MDTMIVTGGAGFIGANFVRMALQKAEVRIVVVDKLTYAGHRENLDGLWDHSRLEFVQADIADVEEMTRVMDTFSPRWVLNFAAESHVDRSIDDPYPFIHTNVTGTLVLLDAARRFLKYGDADRHLRQVEHEDHNRVVLRRYSLCTQLAVCGFESRCRSFGSGLLSHLWSSHADHQLL